MPPFSTKTEKQLNQIGVPSAFACPDCHGVLWKIENSDELLHYECRVGHTYSTSNLASSINEMSENALWAALRALEEKESIMFQIAEKAKRDNSEAADYFAQKAKFVKKHVQEIRKILKSISTSG